jgi:hypothetical protein
VNGLYVRRSDVVNALEIPAAQPEGSSRCR